ncbi:amylosucrase [Robiginitalea myxolifaciens]|uniref:Amylosucrase n=1 Tax=Robiginitalea myxolifaciens TaxID=400055 RepID=A0A1I6G5K0_9FLAO|nr:alpha-amylase family protein [Robiginitalea myxolifaciens]SFR37474.1 amylosucrase [Robiginitalea myxolifaciens]
MNQSAIHRFLAENGKKGKRKPTARDYFESRLAANLSLMQSLFLQLYPGQEERFKDLIQLLEASFKNRGPQLREVDSKRVLEDDWYQQQHWVGMQLYVDRFCGDLATLERKIPYFQSLGINFLHLMPLTKRPAGENDGGYAVSSYTEIDPKFGSDEDLQRLTARFREKGIILMLDFVVNHTSDEFPWALKAKAGETEFREYYYTYPNRHIPDQFEESLPEVFPATSPGNFTWIPEMERWVMTVFNSYQWDLNYTNPRVFLAMFENLAALVNLGVDIVRFDALAFLWKRIGTDSQNLPEAHTLISLFRLCLQVVAPGAILLAEAIVAPKEIVRYFGEGSREGNECEIAYHATFMACLWNSIATKKSTLLRHSLEHMPEKPREGTWINYVRCHDDIGLGFDDSHIAALGWNPDSHRKFLLDYFCQRLDWSPAKGAIFMYNPETGDGRITGSAASLLGLEKALEDGDAGSVARAIDAIKLLYGIVLAAPGIPLVYAGDEIGMLNDYSYLKNPDQADDSRWLNRPFHDWDKVAALDQEQLPSTRIFNILRDMIALRKSLAVFADTSNTRIHNSGNNHLFILERIGAPGVLCIANFDRTRQVVNAGWLERIGYLKAGKYRDLLAGSSGAVRSGLLEMEPLGLLWLEQMEATGED